MTPKITAEQRAALLERGSPVAVEDERELLFSVGRRPSHRILFRIADNVVEVLLVGHVAQDEIRPADV